jgi:hypothetical protein
MKRSVKGIIAILWMMAIVSVAQNNPVIANPIDLNYRFQSADQGNYRREAADPVCEYFKGKYYLFVSKSGGYWSSEDLANWTYIPCSTISTIENYAPTILILGDEMYFMSSWRPSKIYKTTNPDLDDWQLIDTKFDYQTISTQDPAFFLDDDGRVYIYWGCSDKYPIMGVEVDPSDGFSMLGQPKALIEHHYAEYGWEEKGENNHLDRDGYNEGPCMIKISSKYHLQYAANGTQFRTYADGTYVADEPLGPFTYEETSPFSIKPGGFIGGAGHGHTFKDKFGNFWHVATMRISVRHPFERRIGLFPSYLTKYGTFHSHTVLTDLPFEVPQQKVDFETHGFGTGWWLLSYGKHSAASSFMDGFEHFKANDEMIESWWSAQSGDVGEWWQVDLGEQMRVNAIQINFADHDFNKTDRNSYVYYQYLVECSDDGVYWRRIVDKSANTADRPHELVVLESPIYTRFLRIINGRKLEGKFSMYDFRVFGNGLGDSPDPVSGFAVERGVNRKRFQFKWKKTEDAIGYIINWGVKRDLMFNSVMVINQDQFEAGYFNNNSPYFFSLDSFNENGITKGETVIVIE